MGHLLKEYTGEEVNSLHFTPHSLWGGHACQDALDDPLGRYFFRLRLVGHEQPVPQHVRRCRLYVLWRDVAATVEERLTLGRPDHEERRPRTGPELDERPEIQSVVARPAGGVNQVEDVVLDLRIDINLIDRLLQDEQVLRGQDGLDGQVRG